MENQEKEIWKDIVGYEDNYCISYSGKVKSKERYVLGKDGRTRIVKGGILIPNRDKKTGYYRVGLCKNGISIKHYIHILIAKSFIPNPQKKPQVNHINCVKTDNKIENLEWVTASENMKHAVENGLVKIPNPKSEITICSDANCNKPHYTRGFCKNCYYSKRRSGELQKKS